MDGSEYPRNVWITVSGLSQKEVEPGRLKKCKLADSEREGTTEVPFKQFTQMLDEVLSACVCVCECLCVCVSVYCSTYV